MTQKNEKRSDFGKAWRIILLLFVGALPIQMIYMGITRGARACFSTSYSPASCSYGGACGAH